MVPLDETLSTGPDASSTDAGKVHGPHAQHQATSRGPERDDPSPTRRTMIQNVARQEMNRREDTGHRPQEDGH